MNINLGERLKIARNRAGLTGVELANKINIEGPTLNKYENNHRVPKADVLAKIAIATNSEPGWLLVGDDLEKTKADYSADEKEYIARLIEVFRTKELLAVVMIKTNIDAALTMPNAEVKKNKISVKKRG